MPPLARASIALTRAQLCALARVGRELGGPILDLWPDARARSAIVQALYAIEDAAAGVGAPDPLEIDLAHLGSVIGDIRSDDCAAAIRARARALLTTALLWRALEDLPDAAGLLDVTRVDREPWRADARRTLAAHGVAVALPGERE